jgi:hypothetical protein
MYLYASPIETLYSVEIKPEALSRFLMGVLWVTNHSIEVCQTASKGLLMTLSFSITLGTS